jgi:hypothetical protein
MGSCPPDAIPTSNGPSLLRNIQMIFIDKPNPLRQIIILVIKGKTMPILSGQIPHWKEWENYNTFI